MPPPETTVPTAPLATAAGSVTVCIATYRRPTQLTQVLDDLERQSRLPDEVVIVVNDAVGCALAAVVRQRPSMGPSMAARMSASLAGRG